MAGSSLSDITEEDIKLLADDLKSIEASRLMASLHLTLQDLDHSQRERFENHNSNDHSVHILKAWIDKQPYGSNLREILAKKLTEADLLDLTPRLRSVSSVNKNRRPPLSRGIKRWFILAGLVFVSAIENGTYRSFGLILNDLTSEYNVSTAFVGTALGLSHTISYCLAIFNGPLLSRFTTRQIMMTGAVLGAVCLALASLAQTGLHFLLCLVAYGIGESTVFMIANALPVVYFPDKFDIASSITLSGGGIGLLIFPLFCQVFIDLYGWRGAVLLLSGINLHASVSGALLQPVKSKRQLPVTTEKLKRQSLESPDGRGNVRSTYCIPKAVKLKALFGDVGNKNESDPCQRPTRPSSVKTSSIKDGALRSETHILPSDMIPSQTMDMSRESDISTHKTDTSVLPCNPVITGAEASSLDITEEHVEFNSEKQDSMDTGASEIEKELEACRGLKAVTKYFDLKLFRDIPVFDVICINMFIFGVPFDGWILFLIPNGLAKGLTSQQVGYLAIGGGIGNIVGQLATGFITSLKVISVEALYFIVNLISATLFCLNFLAQGVWFILVLSILNGIFLGSLTSLQFIMIKNAVGEDRHKAAVCICSFFVGIGFVTGGYIIGKLFDVTQSYNLSFGFLGLVNIICGLLIIVPKLYGWCKRKYSKSANSVA